MKDTMRVVCVGSLLVGDVFALLNAVVYHRNRRDKERLEVRASIERTLVLTKSSYERLRNCYIAARERGDICAGDWRNVTNKVAERYNEYLDELKVTLWDGRLPYYIEYLSYV